MRTISERWRRCVWVIDDISFVDERILIPFKARAFLDLSECKAKGERVDARHIRKHRGDVFRLVQLLPGEGSLALPRFHTGRSGRVFSGRSCGIQPSTTRPWASRSRLLGPGMFWLEDGGFVPTFPAGIFFSDSGTIRDKVSSPSRVFQVATTLSGSGTISSSCFWRRPAAVETAALLVSVNSASMNLSKPPVRLPKSLNQRRPENKLRRHAYQARRRRTRRQRSTKAGRNKLRRHAYQARRRTNTTSTLNEGRRTNSGDTSRETQCLSLSL